MPISEGPLHACPLHRTPETARQSLRKSGAKEHPISGMGRETSHVSLSLRAGRGTNFRITAGTMTLSPCESNPNRIHVCRRERSPRRRSSWISFRCHGKTGLPKFAAPTGDVNRTAKPFPQSSREMPHASHRGASLADARDAAAAPQQGAETFRRSSITSRTISTTRSPATRARLASLSQVVSTLKSVAH